ncbi:MAG: hypothetical protein PHC89_02960 [Candidatus Pacebacteria bacterium]|nr:hypothetical protein [Candidatus Paceibacterota bacterium]
MFQTNIFLNPFTQMWNQVVIWFPKLIIAILIFIFGLILAKLVYTALVKIFGSTLDKVISPLAGAVERAGYKVRVGHILGWIVKWFIIILFTLVALDIAEFTSARQLLVLLISYLPGVVGAVIVLVGGFMLADFVKKIVSASTKILNARSTKLVSSFAYVTIVVLTFLIVLDLLGLGRILNIVLTGLISMLALAGGLAFGLGGKDAARDTVESIKRSLK